MLLFSCKRKSELRNSGFFCTFVVLEVNYTKVFFIFFIFLSVGRYGERVFL